MLTFKEALAIAQKEKRRINHCVEYTNAYMFSWDTGEDTDGGESPIVVMKETGETMGMDAYIWTPGKNYIGERKIDETDTTTTGSDTSLQKELEKLTPEQSRELAAQYNGGLGSGMTPAEYKAKYCASLLPDASQKQAPRIHAKRTFPLDLI